MSINNTNNDDQSPNGSQEQGSDDGIIVINMDGFDLGDGDNFEDPPPLPKEESKDPPIRKINSNLDLNMENSNNSPSGQFGTSQNASLANEIDTVMANKTDSMAPSRSVPQNEKSSENGSINDDDSNNDLVVKLDLNQIDLGMNDDNSLSNIKQDEEETKAVAKISTVDQIPHQPVLTSNTSANHMPPSPHTQNMDSTSNADLSNVNQNQIEEKEILEPEVAFPKEDNAEDEEDEGEDSDQDMKINIQYNEDSGQFNIRDMEVESDKSESAISLNIKKANNDSFKRVQPDSTKITLPLNNLPESNPES